ncbi:MAG TPA: hypothetical protein VF322_00815 [Gammaproteobacteria bacterium]
MTVRLAIVPPLAAAARGERRFGEFARQWRVASRAAGGDCDEAAEAVRRQGAPHGIAVFRRPGRAQAAVLVGDVRRAVAAARDHCLPS